MDYEMVGIAVAVLLIVLLIVLLETRHLYVCVKCGFQTYEEIEAAGHEKLENSHKVV